MIELLEKTKSQTIDKSDAIDILDRTIDFVRNCDNKASIFLGIFGIILTILLTTEGVNNLVSIFNTAIAQISFCNIVYLVLTVASVIITLFGLSQIVRVLGAQVDFPKKEGLDNDSKIFFGHIAKNTNYISYRTKLLNVTDEEFINDIVSEIYINSCICSSKYKKYKCGLKWSLIGFFAFIVLWMSGTIFF